MKFENLAAAQTCTGSRQSFLVHKLTRWITIRLLVHDATRDKTLLANVFMQRKKHLDIMEEPRRHNKNR